jgi:RecJ-like exonuclease
MDGTDKTVDAPQDLNPGDEAPPGTAGTGEDVCPDCRGTGRIRQGACPNCGGSGKIISGVGGG